MLDKKVISEMKIIEGRHRHAVISHENAQFVDNFISCDEHLKPQQHYCEDLFNRFKAKTQNSFAEI